MKPYPVFFILAMCWLSACIPIVMETPPAVSTSTSTPSLTFATPLIPTEPFVPSPTPLPLVSVAFYRVQVEYRTTSDWSVLELLTPDHVLTTRVIDIVGEPTSYVANPERLALNQPLPAAEVGDEVGMIVEYALAPEMVEQTLEYRLQRGALNASVIRFFDATGGEMRRIETIVHDQPIQTDPGFNTIEFTLDLGQLAGEEPEIMQLTPAPREKLLWAFYYPWYSSNDWASPALKDHPLTRYSSGDETAIARQIQEAQSAGIDGFISSWWGPGSESDRNLSRLLASAQEMGFWVTIYFETLAGEDGSPLSEEDIYAWLAYAIPRYRDQPAFFKMDGKPLIVIWASASVPLESWQRVFTRLEGEALEAVFLAMGYDLGSLEIFDGLHDYGVFMYPDLARTYQNIGRAVRYYPLLTSEQAQKIWAATVQPGYDDTLLPGREGLVRDREEGAFYRRTFEAALASDPDFIFITSWNEWWEHTYIEPGEKYGNLFLQITREYAGRWKGP